MIGYRCKCGKVTGWSTDGMHPCQGCNECNTTLATHPDEHKPLKPHEERIIYNRSTGKPDYIICKRCGATIRKIEE